MFFKSGYDDDVAAGFVGPAGINAADIGFVVAGEAVVEDDLIKIQISLGKGKRSVGTPGFDPKLSKCPGVFGCVHLCTYVF